MFSLLQTVREFFFGKPEVFLQPVPAAEAPDDPGEAMIGGPDHPTAGDLDPAPEASQDNFDPATYPVE